MLGAVIMADAVGNCGGDGTSDHLQQPSSKDDGSATKTAESGYWRAEAEWRQWNSELDNGSCYCLCWACFCICAGDSGVLAVPGQGGMAVATKDHARGVGKGDLKGS